MKVSSIANVNEAKCLTFYESKIKGGHPIPFGTYTHTQVRISLEHGYIE